MGGPCHLPSYSPQLNPEERLNADLKQQMGKRVPVRTKAKLRDAANDHMAMLEQNPERVMSEVIGPPAPQIVPKKHVALAGGMCDGGTQHWRRPK